MSSSAKSNIDDIEALKLSKPPILPPKPPVGPRAPCPALAGWDELRRFTVVEQALQADPLFKTGHGSRDSRTHRILMPCDCLQACLQSTISRHVEALRSRACFAFDLEPRVAESLWRTSGCSRYTGVRFGEESVA